MIGLYRPGESLIHRLAPGVKLVALAALALLVTLVPQNALTLVSLAALVLIGYLVAGLGLGELWAQIAPLRWLIALMVVIGLVFLTPWQMVLTTSRVVMLVLLAALVTLTTRTEALLTTIEAAMRPLQRVGVDPRRASLTVSLTLSMIPVIAGFAQRIREAHHARGARLGPRAVVTMLVMSLRHADDVADAMTARGID